MCSSDSSDTSVSEKVTSRKAGSMFYTEARIQLLVVLSFYFEKKQNSPHKQQLKNILPVHRTVKRPFLQF